MWDTNLNLMELLHSPVFTFEKELEKKKMKQEKVLSEFKHEDLDEYYFSAPVKRMVWQTLLLIKEIEKILGKAPERVFIEMTRSEDERKQRTVSRKNQLLNLYKNIKDEERDWASFIENVDANGTLRSKKIYLYICQMGRSAYSGNPIDLDRLDDYDIDHIYPRHFVKDDNIANNLVLVEKPLNIEKGDIYPIKEDIRNNPEIRNLWEMLREKNLMTEEKYRRLTGKEAFTDEQFAGFIARQLVETSQATKGVADLLKQILPDTKLVYSKASNVARFRQQYDFPKSRLVNEFHHANDAYLNIVVGNVYYTKFTQNPMNYIKDYRNDSQKYAYNLYKLFERDVERGGYTAWVAEDKNRDGHGTIVTVRKVMSKNTPLLTRMSFEGHGQISDGNIVAHSKAKDKVYIPIKGNNPKLADVEKYGGLNKTKTAYFFLVEHEVKGQRVRTLETVPLYLKAKLERDDNLTKYCEADLGLVKPSVRVARIPIQSALKINNYLVNISRKTNKQLGVRNAMNLCLAQNWISYIRLLEKDDLNSNLLNSKKNLELYDLLTEKHQHAVFANRQNPVGGKLVTSRQKFVELSADKQAYILNQILLLTSIGASTNQADLSLIGESAHTGAMLISKEITKYKSIEMINQSVTGMFEKRIDLLTI